MIAKEVGLSWSYVGRIIRKSVAAGYYRGKTNPRRLNHDAMRQDRRSGMKLRDIAVKHECTLEAAGRIVTRIRPNKPKIDGTPPSCFNWREAAKEIKRQKAQDCHPEPSVNGSQGPHNLLS